MLTADVSGRWSRARRPGDPSSAAPWARLQAQDRQPAAPWQQGLPRERDSVQPWGDVPAQDAGSRQPWGRAELASADPVAVPWGDVPACDIGRWLGWDRSIQPRDTLRLRLIYNPSPARKDIGAGQRYNRSDEFGQRYDAEGERQASLYWPGNLISFDFGGSRYSPSTTAAVFFDFRFTPLRRAIQPVDSGTAESWGSARQLNQRMRLPWGRGSAKDPGIVIPYPDYTGPAYEIVPAVEPDILETYMIANSVSLVVLPGREPVDATGIKVARDIDAFAWTLSAELFGRTSLNPVRPDANGPKTVELTINGWTWLFLIERYSTQGKFPSERFTVTGVSRTQLLAEPYAPKRSAVNAADINAVQAATDQLENTGFSLSWDYTALGPPDWTIPAGAFSYQEQTALQVIARVAEAVGGVVRPARDSDALAVVPRYREAPWAWSTSVMDRIIPAEIVGQWGGEWSPQPSWDSCYVSGTTHGVAVDVRRTGTAGSAPAPDVFDDLITGTDAARHRGIAEIAKGGNQEIVTLSLPLFPQGGSAPGLVDPAHLCEVRDIDGTWRGLCLSTEISAEGVGASRVTQALKLERHH